MIKMEELTKMLNSENGGLIAAISGIVLVFGIDRITKSNYKADVKKDSITLAPVSEAEQSQAEVTDITQ